MAWFVSSGDPFANEMERWVLASLLDRLTESIKSFGLEDAFSLIPLTKRFRNLPDSYKLAAVFKGYLCLVDPLDDDQGYDSAVITEGIALLFEQK